MNKTILIGNLGNDPELRYTANAIPVANFRMATNEKWNNAQGERQERTEWHRVVVWGKMAETCGKFLAKGRQVCIEGKLQTRQWEDRDGNTRYTTEIIANRVEFLGGSRNQNTSTEATEHEVPEATMPTKSQETQQLFNEDVEAPF